MVGRCVIGAIRNLRYIEGDERTSLRKEDVMCANQVRRQAKFTCIVFLCRMYSTIHWSRLAKFGKLHHCASSGKKETGSRNKRVLDNRRGATRTNQFTVFAVRQVDALRLEDLPCDRDTRQYVRTQPRSTHAACHAFALIYDYGGGFVSLDAGLPN